MKFNVKSLLKDKTVLYVVLFFAITNFFGYILLKNYDAVMFMVLVGLITSYFSKNMIVILLSSIILTTFLTTTSTIKEGLVGVKDGDKEKDNENEPEPEPVEKDKETVEKDKGKRKEDKKKLKEDEDKLKKDKDKLKKDKEKLKKDKEKLQGFLNTKKENFNPVEAMAQLEPLMKSAEGMMGMLDKTNAIGRMEGLLTRMNDMQK